MLISIQQSALDHVGVMRAIVKRMFIGYLIEIPSPSLQGVAVIKKEDKLLHSMIEPTLETEKVIPLNVEVTEEQENPVPFLEEEIECPRCHDSMMLCSDFDNLYYVCHECDFCLYTIKKAAS